MIRPRQDQANFHAYLDEDGARAIVRGEIPDYIKEQCADFLVGVDDGIAAMMDVMRRRTREADIEEPRDRERLTVRRKRKVKRKQTGDDRL